MKILLLCTAHNSLSQRIYLALKNSHRITIEYALSQDVMCAAVNLSQPDLIICPFLTAYVPHEIFESYLTLVIHPGPPGDAGPSSLDWLLLGDDGTLDDSDQTLRCLDHISYSRGRSHWGVTVLQAVQEFDAGPVWAFDQFQINIDEPELTKATLYHGPITQCAVRATLAAISRIQLAGPCSPRLHARSSYRVLSIRDNAPFRGSNLRRRPLLKASDRDFDVTRHVARQISRRIRCSDSQPGALSKIFGPVLYLYGGQLEDEPSQTHVVYLNACKIIACRGGSVCIATIDKKGVWITHVRRPKTKADKALNPKVSAITGLTELGILSQDQVGMLDSPVPTGWLRSPTNTFQDIWIDMHPGQDSKRIAYLYFNIYNGAMTTDHCSRLIDAMDYILLQHAHGHRIEAVVLMGGAYFSNGIALNVVEAAADPSFESWLHINRINDVVRHVLHEFPSRGIRTVAAIRGNAAAGGVALATACDLVLAGAEVVLNPAYRAIGLSGSEYHTLSYHGRCGPTNARYILRAMKPIGTLEAQSLGLVDHVLPGTGHSLNKQIYAHISRMIGDNTLQPGRWKQDVDLSSSSLARARDYELYQMALDFWSARSVRYHSRRFDFIRKVKPIQTPLRFAEHRRCGNSDPEETDDFDNVNQYKKLAVRDIYVAIMAEALADVNSSGLMSNQHEAPLDQTPREKGSETMFACYYNTSANLPPSPPQSPP